MNGIISTLFLTSSLNFKTIIFILSGFIYVCVFKKSFHFYTGNCPVESVLSTGRKFSHILHFADLDLKPIEKWSLQIKER